MDIAFYTAVAVAAAQTDLDTDAARERYGRAKRHAGAEEPAGAAGGHGTTRADVIVARLPVKAEVKQIMITVDAPEPQARLETP